MTCQTTRVGRLTQTAVVVVMGWGSKIKKSKRRKYVCSMLSDEEMPTQPDRTLCVCVRLIMSCFQKTILRIISWRCRVRQMRGSPVCLRAACMFCGLHAYWKRCCSRVLWKRLLLVMPRSPVGANRRGGGVGGNQLTPMSFYQFRPLSLMHCAAMLFFFCFSP